MDFLLNLDTSILLFIQEYLRNPVLTAILRVITTLGEGGVIWIVLSVALLIPKKTRKVGCMGLLALLLMLIINNIGLKNLIARPRPYTVTPEIITLASRPSSYSFPSGHTASSFAAAGVFYRKLPKKFGIPAIVLAAVMGLSRMYVGVHYTTDVLGGMLCGIAISYLATWLWTKLESLVNKAKAAQEQ